jgi:hypothetical protein
MTSQELSWSAKADHPVTTSARCERCKTAFTGSSAFADDDKDLTMISRTRDLRIKVIPVRIQLLDQSNLPGSIPGLKTLFSSNCGLNVSMRFEIDKSVNSILLRKARCRVSPVLVDSADQVVCHSYVERSAEFARKNVHPIIALGAHNGRSSVLDHPPSRMMTI